MSMISKICNLTYLNHLKPIFPLASSNLNRNLKLAEANVERYYSKRYSYCDSCKVTRKCVKQRIKPRKTPNRCPAPGPDCVPFKQGDCKPKRKPKSSSQFCNKSNCKPGMRNKCDTTVCPPECSLTKAHYECSCNECPRKEPIAGTCPTGNWDKDST